MAINFTAAERQSITRRQVRVDAENSALQGSVNSFLAQESQLLAVDDANKKFYLYYDNICRAYENEARCIDGNIPDTYPDSDIDAAAQNPMIPPFFPTDLDPDYYRRIPLIQDGGYTNNKVKGFFHPTGVDLRYEQNILSNADKIQGLVGMIDFLLNGITGTIAASASTQNPVHNIPAGTVTNLSIDVTTNTNFTIGDYVFINNGSSSGIYIVTGKTTGHLIISSVLPSQIGFSTVGSSINNTVVGFTNTERQNLTSGSYQELLTNLTNLINTTITEWEGKVDNQLALVNEDDRSPQQSQIAAALSDANNTKTIIDTWQARSNTGTNGKYTDNGIPPISAEITARQSFMTSRLSEITIALGGTSGNALSQSANTYSTSVANNPYYNRYKWLNFRINRTSGSLRRYYASNQAKNETQNILNDNISIKNEYATYFLTKPLVSNDGSDILHLKDVSGLSVGNSITIVSETQPEISRTIVEIMGTTQILINSAVSQEYKLEDIARIFKTL